MRYAEVHAMIRARCGAVRYQPLRRCVYVFDESAFAASREISGWCAPSAENECYLCAAAAMRRRVVRSFCRCAALRRVVARVSALLPPCRHAPYRRYASASVRHVAMPPTLCRCRELPAPLRARSCPPLCCSCRSPRLPRPMIARRLPRHTCSVTLGYT